MKIIYTLLLCLSSVIFNNAATAQCRNVALGKPATASEFLDSVSLPGFAFDGNCARLWNAGKYTFQPGVRYIQVDLQAQYTVNNINMKIEQTPSPAATTHEIYTSVDMIGWMMVDSFTLVTSDGEVIQRCYSGNPLTNVRGVKVITTSSPSWVSWREIGVFEVGNTVDTPAITASSLVLCQADSVILTCEAGSSYLWSTGATTQSIVVKTAGQYCVSRGGPAPCNAGTLPCTQCSSSGSSCITITEDAVQLQASGDTSICPFNSVQLHASGGATYLWSPGTGLSDSTIADPIATPAVTTTYTVTGSSSGCVSSMAIVTVVVNPDPPTPLIMVNHDTLYCTTDPAYIAYQWYDDTVLVSGATDTLLVILHSGNYNVQVTNAYGCKIAVGINIILDVQQYDNTAISFFPNPASTQYTIQLSYAGNKTPAVFIRNVPGQTVHQSVITGSRHTIDISFLPAGIYFAEVVGDCGRWVRKFVKH